MMFIQKRLMDFETVDLTRKRGKNFTVLLPKGRILIQITEDKDAIHVSADDNYIANKCHELLPIGRIGLNPTNKDISLFIVEGNSDLNEKPQVFIQTRLEYQSIEFHEIPLYSLFVRKWRGNDENVYMKISPLEGVNLKTRQKEGIEPYIPVRELLCI